MECKKCNYETDYKFNICPNCNEKQSNSHKMIIMIVSIVLISSFCFIFYNQAVKKVTSTMQDFLDYSLSQKFETDQQQLVLLNTNEDTTFADFILNADIYTELYNNSDVFISSELTNNTNTTYQYLKLEVKAYDLYGDVMSYAYIDYYGLIPGDTWNFACFLYINGFNYDDIDSYEFTIIEALEL